MLAVANMIKLDVNEVRQEMNATRFKQLVVGEKFRLSGSDVLMIKETLRQEPGLGCVNATYDITAQGRLCYVHDNAQVVRRRSNEDTELKQRMIKQNLER